MPERLAGGSVALRPLCADDAQAYVQAFRDDGELGRLLGLEEDPTEADVRHLVDGSVERARQGRSVFLAICAASDDSFVGEVLLHSFSWPNLRCELGFWLAPAARGRGLGADAIGAALSWAFDELAIERMEMATTPDNAPSRTLAVRLGFLEEGVQRKRNLERGVRVDLVVFGLLARDWRSGRRTAR